MLSFIAVSKTGYSGMTLSLKIIMNTILVCCDSRNSYRTCLFFLYASLILLLIRFLFMAFLKLFFGTVMATCAGEGISAGEMIQIICSGNK
jgi:hypothetical protein